MAAPDNRRVLRGFLFWTVICSGNGDAEAKSAIDDLHNIDRLRSDDV